MNGILHKSDWAHLIPHAGSMCLLDAVLAWDERTIHMAATSHRDPDNPLRRDGRLHAVHLAEYGAQTTAVHGALRAHGGTSPRPGMLASLRDLQLFADHVDRLDGQLDVHAECLYADDTGAQYAFRIEHHGRVLASGRAAIIHRSAPR